MAKLKESEGEKDQCSAIYIWLIALSGRVSLNKLVLQENRRINKRTPVSSISAYHPPPKYETDGFTKVWLSTYGSACFTLAAQLKDSEACID